MTLTKQEAIENHRKMWNWIADELEKKRESNAGVVDTISIKMDYFLHNKISPNNIPSAYCYCCEYAKAKDGHCTDRCPIDWGTSKKHYVQRLYIYAAFLQLYLQRSSQTRKTNSQFTRKKGCLIWIFLI
jgi:hypothetical protein